MTAIFRFGPGKLHPAETDNIHKEASKSQAAGLDQVARALPLVRSARGPDRIPLATTPPAHKQRLPVGGGAASGELELHKAPSPALVMTPASGIVPSSRLSTPTDPNHPSSTPIGYENEIGVCLSNAAHNEFNRLAFDYGPTDSGRRSKRIGGRWQAR